jgi:hypothetical protein
MRTTGVGRLASHALTQSVNTPSGQPSGSSQSRVSPQAGRRLSTVLMNLQLNDPSVPAPGEMVPDQSSQQHASPQPGSVSPFADPHHHRAPSIGEIHQELEAEQEAQVNRLLQQIRQQQVEIQRLQTGHGQPGHGASADESSAISERSSHGIPIGAAASSPAHTASGAVPGSYPRSPVFPHPRSSFDMARADFHRRSRTPSRGASPRLRATSISAESGEMVLGGRDESAFYQAETQMLTRENQMLRHRIRDLEKQLTDLSASPTAAAEPAVSSQLTRSSTNADEEHRPSTDGGEKP